MANILKKLNKIPVWQKLIALFVLIGIQVVLFHFMSWKPIDETVEKKKGELRGLERTLTDQQAVAVNLATFQENTKRLEDDLKEALTQLPKDKELPALLRDIYTLGKKSGVEFKSFTPQAEAKKQLYAELPIKLNLTGDYHEIAVFFDRVGKLSRIVNVSALDLTGGGKSDTGEGLKLNVNCTLTTFMFLGKAS